MILRDPLDPNRFHSGEPPGAARPALELADIFRQFGPAYRAAHKLLPEQQRVMNAIENCRTAALGGHLYRCPDCSHEQPEYNSCRNRHCPKCQRSAAEKWLAARQAELLPVPYFHIVFTIPHDLNPLALANPRLIYNILFQAASETLLTLGRDPKHLGGLIGLTAVLHTWGQNLAYHPHLHCIVPGGALSDDGRWLAPKKSKKEKKFFIHVNVISDLFKKKFLACLVKAFQADQLKFVGEVAALKSADAFNRFKNGLYDKKWVTYCKRPFGGPQQVLAYLSRYTHRVAISNSRLIKIEAGRVCFKWKDYRQGGQLAEMSLPAEEFIRRFLLHVLPDGFMKIRHYGFLASRSRQTKLVACQELLGPVEDVAATEEDEELVLPTARVCACCGSRRLVCLGEIPNARRSGCFGEARRSPGQSLANAPP